MKRRPPIYYTTFPHTPMPRRIRLGRWTWTITDETAIYNRLAAKAHPKGRPADWNNRKKQFIVGQPKTRQAGVKDVVVQQLDPQREVAPGDFFDADDAAVNLGGVWRDGDTLFSTVAAALTVPVCR